MADFQLLEDLLFDPEGLQVYWHVASPPVSRHAYEAEARGATEIPLRLMTLSGAEVEVWPDTLTPVQPAEVTALLPQLWQSSALLNELLQYADQDSAGLLTANSAEEFVAELMRLSGSDQLPELEKRFALLEQNAAQTAKLVAQGYVPVVETQAFAMQQQHPALVALLALCRLQPELPILQPHAAEVYMPPLSLNIAPPNLDFSAQRVAQVLRQDMTRRKRHEP